MDASILQLFSGEEIMERLTRQSASGALHVFTPKEAANLFYKEGRIVAACKGLMEGEEVIHKVLDWKEARFLWQEGAAVPAGLRPVEIDVANMTSRLKNLPKNENGTNALVHGKAPETKPLVSVSSHAVTTGPMTMGKPSVKKEAGADSSPLPASVNKQNLVPVTTSLSATKNVGDSPREDESFEEALMRKHKLALVAVGTTPAQRLRIIRASNLVGRNPACDFTLNHGSISRQHCLLQIMERGLHVKDLSTTNGTKVNGIPLTEGYVSVGDKLTIGHLEFVVEKDEPEV